MSRVTIQALAHELGMSKSTVSRALNDYPDISLETKRRVSATAVKFGYHPSSQARGLRTGRTQAVGLVLDMDSGNTHKPFLSNFIDGISRTLSKHRWTLSVATASGMSALVDTHRQLLVNHMVDGFIIPRNHQHDARIKLLTETDVPFVVYGRCNDEESKIPCFDILSEDAMKHAVERLYHFGHRRLAYVGGHQDAIYEHLRRTGFLETMSQYKLECDPGLNSEMAVTEEQGKRAGLNLLQQTCPPTAIVCAIDRAALGVCEAISEFGLNPGKEVSVTGYDGIPEGRYADPKLTTFAVDNQLAGATLAKLLVNKIENKPIENLHELHAAKLVTGSSDGPAQLNSQELYARIKQ